MLTPELLRILRCPETRQPLALLDAAALSRLNENLSPPLSAALIREDRRVLYPVISGIPQLTPLDAISERLP